VLELVLEVELGEDLGEGHRFDKLLVVNVVAAGGAGDLVAAAETWILWQQRRDAGGGSRSATPKERAKASAWLCAME
jgi:hypothetical protein